MGKVLGLSTAFCLLLMLSSSRIHAGDKLPKLLISFDEPGYVKGSELAKAHHPHGTSWKGRDGFVITAGEGVEGSNGLVLTPLAANRTITFDPTSNELPGFDGNSSVVEVSFQYRFLEEPNSGLKGALAAVLFGFDETSGQRRGAVRFAILRNGGLTYSDGPSTSRLANLNDRQPYEVASKETVTKVSAILDYSSKTYSFSINDVTQSQTYSFFNKTLSGITICIQNIGDEGDQRRVVFDNFSVTLSP